MPFLSNVDYSFLTDDGSSFACSLPSVSSQTKIIQVLVGAVEKGKKKKRGEKYSST